VSTFSPSAPDPGRLPARLPRSFEPLIIAGRTPLPCSRESIQAITRRNWTQTWGRSHAVGCWPLVLLFHNLQHSAVRNMERAVIPRSVAMRINSLKVRQTPAANFPVIIRLGAYFIRWWAWSSKPLSGRKAADRFDSDTFPPSAPHCDLPIRLRRASPKF